MSSGFSRRVNLKKGTTFAGKLGRSGIAGAGGVNPKHLRSAQGASRHSSLGSNAEVSEGLSGLPSSIGDILSNVDDKERDKIQQVTSKIRSESLKRGTVEHADEVSPYMPDFSFNPTAYDPYGDRDARHNKNAKRKAPSLADDPKTLGIVISVFFGSILLFMGLGQIKSCTQAREALKVKGSVWELPEPPTPEPAKSIFEVYPGSKKK